jgi:hypothetical protein
MGSYNSYGQQAGHYFDRPHQAPAREPLRTPAAWRGAEMAGSPAWRVRLDDAQIGELERALAAARSTRKPTGELKAADFPLPRLAGEIARWRSEVDTGRGFQVVSGVPVERWSTEDAEIAFWCMGLHMGTPGAQNPQGDLLGHVIDTGDDADDPYVRLYRTRSNIAFHCDAADVVGLLCLETAPSGGTSRIASSVTVYNEVLRRQPDRIDRLYEPFLVDVRNEDASGQLRYLPVPPCRYADGRLRTFYHSDYFRSVVRHDDVSLSAEDESLLDLYEKIASDAGIRLDMDLEPGDIQWLSNHTIVHARTGYTDPGDSDRKRHLLRLWLSI